MKFKTSLLLASLVIGASSAHAALSHWQTAVGTGTTATATKFTTVSTPETINVGTTAGTAMSFEFIVNAGSTPLEFGASILLGDSTNNQYLAWEHATDTNNYGITNFKSGGFGTKDSGVALTADTDTHLVFTTDGTNTYLYVNGALAHTFTGAAIDIAGLTGLGGALLNGGFNSALPGNILGFAAYNSQLSATEIAAHSAAFVRAVPEPSTTALLGFGGLALILRRRK